jgi:hypothetical protein
MNSYITPPGDEARASCNSVFFRMQIAYYPGKALLRRCQLSNFDLSCTSHNMFKIPVCRACISTNHSLPMDNTSIPTEAILSAQLDNWICKKGMHATSPNLIGYQAKVSTSPNQKSVFIISQPHNSVFILAGRALSQKPKFFYKQTIENSKLIYVFPM